MSNHPSGRLFNKSGNAAVPLFYLGGIVRGNLVGPEAAAVAATVPGLTEEERKEDYAKLIAKENISPEELSMERYIGLEAKKYKYATPVYIYHNFTGMTEDEKKQIESEQRSKDTIEKILENMSKRLRFTDGTRGFAEVMTHDLDQVLQIFIKNGTIPFDNNFAENFPFVLILNKKRYVLSLNPLETINNPDGTDGTSIILNYVKTLRVYVNNNNVEFIDFIEEDPSSESHFKKKASPKVKRASPKAKKRASQKKKKASPKKRASPKAKKRASPKAKKKSSH